MTGGTSDDGAYAEYRREILRDRLDTAALAVFGMTAAFQLLLVMLAPAQWRAEWTANATLLLVPFLVWASGRSPLRRYPEWIFFGADLVFAGGIVSRLLMPTAWTSGIEAFVSINLMGAAVLIPWSARLQAIITSITLVTYWIILAGSGRMHGGELAHQLTSPLFAGALSIVGVASLDRLRRQSFKRRRAAEREALVSGHFAAIMSHELRNLLTAVQGYGEILDAEGREEGGPLADVPRRLETLARQGLDVIDVALDLSRAERGNLSMKQSRVDFGEIIDELKAEFHEARIPPGVALEWPSGRGIWLQTDPVKLKMILRNLLGNAIKFTLAGHVRLTASAADGQIEVTVADTGPGIAPHEIATIFEPFRQGIGGLSRSGSAGLGLYVVERLVTTLGGSLRIESELGRGTTFRVTLPR